MACISGKTETDTRASGKTASNTVRVLIYSRMGIPTQVPTSKVNQMAKDSTSGSRAVSTSANSGRVSSTAKENGKNNTMSLPAISTMESILMTEKTDTAFSPGKVEMSTEEIILTMSVTGMVRCSGQTVPYIRASGNRGFNMATGK